jgi:cytochrome c2
MVWGGQIRGRAWVDETGKEGMAQIAGRVDGPKNSRVRRWSTTLLVVSGLTALLLILTACAGVDDSGSDANTLATMETRKAPPPAASPAGGSASPVGEGNGTAVGGATEGNADQGKQLASSLGCVGCHSIDGSKLVGPSWKGLYGHEVKLSGGDTVTADDAYIHESIVNPSAKVVDGFQPIMPSFQGQANDQQIADIIAYIKTLE